MKVMKLLMCRMLAFWHQIHLLQQTIFYSTSVPGETTGKPVEQFSVFFIENSWWFSSLLDAGLRLGQWGPRLLKTEMVIFRSGGILNHLVKGDAFDTIYLTTSSPNPLQKTNKHDMEKASHEWLEAVIDSIWATSRILWKSALYLCCSVGFLYDTDERRNSWTFFMIVSFSEWPVWISRSLTVGGFWENWWGNNMRRNVMYRLK